jgi:hypothetical protein
VPIHTPLGAKSANIWLELIHLVIADSHKQIATVYTNVFHAVTAANYNVPVGTSVKRGKTIPNVGKATVSRTGIACARRADLVSCVPPGEDRE